jgi:type IV pilus assembly protein PilW
MRTTPRRLSKGLSLIELMIALLIGVILLLGLVQVFGASRTAYQLSQGAARAQENGRFAVDYLQRDIRMLGHYGCVNDQARLQFAGSLSSHLAANDNPLNFNISLQGYEATATAPTNTLNLAAPTAGWSPALPVYLSGLNPAPRAGSDIIMLRFLASDGVPVTGLAANSISVDATKWDVLTRGGVANPAVFGVADCSFADVFQASAVNGSAGVVSTSASGGFSTSSPDFENRYTASPAGQTVLYRAESIAYYVGLRQGAEVPSLYRVRFSATPGGAVLSVASEELVEGVENLQLVYGQDQSNDVAQLTGNVTTFNTANSAALGPALVGENNWRRVGQVKIGILAVSPDRATAAAAVDDTILRSLGVRITPPADARYRSIYESTVALRNRLYGN